MSLRPYFIAAGVIVAVGGWYLFRPELLFINERVNESFPAGAQKGPMMQGDAAPMVLASGAFHSGAHETKGMASLYRLPDGKRVLRLTGFSTSNGPDVRVLLISAKDAADSDTVKVAKRIELGSLKGNIGDQNYEVPADADLSEFKAVTIWCNRFNVNFGTAPLSAQTAMGSMPAASPAN